MPCETCSHTLQGITCGHGQQNWWCPRCGTTVVVRGEHRSHEAPYLVEWVRELLRAVAADPLERIGNGDLPVRRALTNLAEAINFKE